MGNCWILLRFANAQDKMLVFNRRPYFINGLNFVLKPWVPFFDPFFADIERLDLWVRISRLPWELWDKQTNSELLTPISVITRVDQNTLLHLKGKFAQVVCEFCPKLPVAKKVEVLVERVDAQGMSPANRTHHPFSSVNSNPIDTWVIVTLKKKNACS